MKLQDEFSSLIDIRNYYKSLRLHGDIFSLNASTYVVTDYQLIRSVLRQPEDFRTFDFGDRIRQLLQIDPIKYDFEDIRDSMSNWLLFMDGPDHLTWKKKLMQRLFGLDLQQIIEEEWEHVCNSLEGHSSFELVTDLCEPLVCRIICSIMGFKPEEFGIIRKFEKTFMKALAPSMSLPALQEIKGAHQQFQQMQLEGWQNGTITQARMLDSLLKDVNESERNRVFSQMEFMMAAGIESSIMLLAETMLRLITDLREFQPGFRTNEHPQWIFEELIRLSSPISLITRKAMNDVTLNEYKIKEGQILLLFTASANADPRYFPYPDQIHQDNLQTPHISFGLGRHHCMGTELSKLEMRFVIPEFVRRFGSFEICHPEKIKKSFYTPGIDSVMIKQKSTVSY